MKDLLISIIVPFCNEGEYISDAINSLLKQTYSNIEIVLVNDHSTDNSKQICLSFSDPRVKYYEKFHIPKGRANARNFGVRMAKGDILTFLDADDVCAKERIELQLNNILKLGINSTICGTWVRKEGIENILLKTPTDHEEIIKGFYRIISRATIVGATIMGHKDIFSKWDFRTKFKYSEDWDFLSRLEESKMIRFSNVPKPLYTYFIRIKGTKYQKDWVSYNIFMRDCQLRRRNREVEYDSPERMFIDLKKNHKRTYLKYKLLGEGIKLKRYLGI